MLFGMQIMLKDMADSKRINQNIHHITTQSERGRQSITARLEGFNATVVSSLFWPSQPVSTWQIPCRLLIKCYLLSFELLLLRQRLEGFSAIVISFLFWRPSR